MFEIANALIDQPAVLFQLRFAGAAQADAAVNSATGGSTSSETWQRVFELGQFDLQPGFHGAGPAGKDIQDQFAAVEHLDVERFFEIASLAGGKVVVEDDHVGVLGLDAFQQLCHLALADVGGGNDAVPFLREFADHDRPRGGRQAAQLLHRIVTLERPVRQRHANKNGPLQTYRQFIAFCVQTHGVCSPSFPLILRAHEEPSKGADLFIPRWLNPKSVHSERRRPPPKKRAQAG